MGFRTKLIKHIYTAIIIPKIFYGSCIWYYRLYNKIDSLGSSAIKIIAGLFSNTSNLATTTVIGVPLIRDMLKNHTIMEILRLHLNNKWNIDLADGHHKANKTLKIKDYIDSYDGANHAVTTEISSSIFSKIDWLNKNVFLNHADIECYTDASVDRKNNRSGIGIICTGMCHFKYTEQYFLITSSYLAEARALDVALDNLIRLTIANRSISFRIDNLSVIQSVMNNLLQSKTFNSIKTKINILKSRNNRINFTWVPSHLSKEHLIHFKALRFNYIADRLAADPTAPTNDWTPLNLKTNLKKFLLIEAFKNLKTKWDDSTLIAKNFKLDQLVTNKINMLNGVSNYYSDFLNFNREEFFLLTSFYTTAGFNRDHCLKILKADSATCAKYKCRGCNQKTETTTHLLTECSGIKCSGFYAARLRIYRKFNFNLDEIEFNPSKLLRFLRQTKLAEMLNKWDELLPDKDYTA